MATLYVSSSFTLLPAIPKLLRSQNTQYSLSPLPLSFSDAGYKGAPLVSPLIGKSKSQLQIRCRFSPRYRSSGYSSRSGAGSNSEATGIPMSVPVRVAHELLQAGHRYLDVRTPEEFSAGHVPGAINIPYMFKFGSGMAKNAKFLERVSSHFGKYDEILVACHLGKRSLMAATDLLSAGYTGVTDIAGGYAAWIQNRLPTES
ncbi:hypothetical protein Ancab_003108 [Ancistrocladus abbreviatus]